MKTLATVFAVILFTSPASFALEKSGTGFAISSNQVLTAYHVVENTIEIIVRFGTTEQPAEISSYNKENDWAILNLSDSTEHFVHIDTSNTSTLGEVVYTLGFPSPDLFGEEMKFTDGTISSQKGLDGLNSFYQISVPIQPGNSGGPLFNKNGMAIGLIVSTVNPAFFMTMTGGALPQNINFALKLSTITNLETSSIPLPNNCSIEDNQKSVCFIRAKESRENIPTKEPTKIDVAPSPVSPISQAQAKVATLLQKLKAFNPNNCLLSSENIGSVLVEQDYEFARCFLDKTYEDTKEWIQKGWSDYGEKEKLKEAQTFWRRARTRLAVHFNKELHSQGHPLPSAFFGIDLYQPNATRYEKDVLTLPVIEGKRQWMGSSIDFYYAQAGGDYLRYGQKGKERIHAYIHRLQKPFLGQHDVVILKTKTGKIPVGILVAINADNSHSQLDTYEATTVLVNSIVSIFEKRFFLKFAPSEKDEIDLPDGLTPVHGSATALLSKGYDWCYHYCDEKHKVNIVGCKSRVYIFIARQDWKLVVEKDFLEEKQKSIESINHQLDSNLDVL